MNIESILAASRRRPDASRGWMVGLLLCFGPAHAGTCAIELPTKSTTASGVLALNNNDVALGWYLDKQGDRISTLYRNGRFEALKNSIPHCKVFSWLLSSATALNDRGDLAGTYACDALVGTPNTYWLMRKGAAVQDFAVPTDDAGVSSVRPMFISSDGAVGGATYSSLDNGLPSGSFYRLPGASQAWVEHSFAGATVKANQRGDLLNSGCSDALFSFAKCVNHISLRQRDGSLSTATDLAAPTTDHTLSAIAITDRRLVIGSTRQYIPLNTAPPPPYIADSAVVYDLAAARYTATIQSPLLPNGQGPARAVAVSPSGNWLALRVADVESPQTVMKAAAASLDNAGNVLSVIDARPEPGPLPSVPIAINDDGTLLAYYGSNEDPRGPYVRFRDGQILFLKNQLPALSAIRTTFANKTGLFAGDAVVGSTQTAFTMRCSAN